MESADIQLTESSIVHDLRKRHILILGVALLSLYAYFHREPSVDAEILYPVPGCFTTLPQALQKDFLLNREYIMKHPDLHQSTKEAMLDGYCQEESVILSLENSEPVSIAP